MSEKYRSLYIGNDGLFRLFFPEGQKLNIHLNEMSWQLLLEAFGVQLAHSCASGQTFVSGIEEFDAVVTRQIPDDPDWSQMIFAAQIHDLLDDLSRRFGWPDAKE